jgi:hypothetical protein
MGEDRTINNSEHSDRPPHSEAIVRQRLGTLLSPEALHVLGLRYEPRDGSLAVGCVGAPCWLQLAPEGSRMWAFDCPWWRTLLLEDNWFETRILAEVGKARMCASGAEQGQAESWVN